MIKAWGEFIDPSLFVAARFLVAAAVLLPFALKNLTCKKTIFVGFILGLLNSGVYLCQTISLNYISAARCAILTGTVVIWVPMFRRIIFGSRITLLHICASVLCLLGLWLLTGSNTDNISRGDLIMLLAEAFFALSLIYLEHVGFDCPNPLSLTFYQILSTCIIPFAIVIFKGETFSPLFNIKPLAAIFFCGIFAIAIVLLQRYYQRLTTNY